MPVQTIKSSVNLHRSAANGTGKTRDGAVDPHDLLVLTAAYDSTVGDPSYRARADLDGDGAIDAVRPNAPEHID